MKNQKTLFFVMIILLLSPFVFRRLYNQYVKVQKKCETRGNWVVPGFFKSNNDGHIILKKMMAGNFNTIFIKVPSMDSTDKEKKMFYQFIASSMKEKLSIHLWFANLYRLKKVKANFTSLKEQKKQVLWVKNWIEKYPQVDGVHLDYIRYENKKNHLKVDLIKEQAVTKTVLGIKKYLSKNAPQKILSAAVWLITKKGKLSGKPDENWPKNAPFHLKFNQNPIQWIKKEIVDVVMVMNYTSITSHWEIEARQWIKRVKSKKNRIVMGLGWLKDKKNPNWKYDIKKMINKIKILRKLKLNGAVLFRFYSFLDDNKDGRDDDFQLIKALTINSSVNKYQAPFKNKICSCLVKKEFNKSKGKY